jgi:mono/diheme cytochrome c family protein
VLQVCPQREQRQEPLQAKRVEGAKTAAVQDHFDWVAEGVPRNDQYGTRGISTGRMPHFANVLTREQIQAIVDYERTL